MRTTSAAIYARVSSDRQVQQTTIASQVAELVERARADGFAAGDTEIFADDGVSGTLLIRPALERLRDRVAEGVVDRVYVHTPDRLARKYAYQVLLLEEFGRHSVEVVFLHGPTGVTAEDQLLVQVQGMIAEYERTRLLERCRRGKLFKAKAGSVSVLSNAPYGYRYIRAAEGEPAHFEVVPSEADVVRRVFAWLLDDHLSLMDIARRLNAAGVPTPRSASRWPRQGIAAILRNPAYMGIAEFQRTEMCEAKVGLRRRRGQEGAVRFGHRSHRVRPAEERIGIPVPALVSVAAFQAAAETLQRNRTLAARNASKGRYLLAGLTRCGTCGTAFVGRQGSKPRADGTRLGYYFCSRPRASMTNPCKNPTIRGDLLEEQVWASVITTLEDPERTLHEWSERSEADGTLSELRTRHTQALNVIARIEQSAKRLGDAYESGEMDLRELSERRGRLRSRLDDARADERHAAKRLAETVELTVVAGTVQRFREKLHHGLATATWEQKREVVRAIIDRVEVHAERVVVVYRVPTTNRPRRAESDDPPEDRQNCRLRKGRLDAATPWRQGRPSTVG